MHYDASQTLILAQKMLKASQKTRPESVLATVGICAIALKPTLISLITPGLFASWEWMLATRAQSTRISDLLHCQSNSRLGLLALQFQPVLSDRQGSSTIHGPAIFTTYI